MPGHGIKAVLFSFFVVRMISAQFLDLFKAGGADIFALIVDNILCIRAENTGRLVLFKDNHVAFGVNLDRISFCDIKSSAKFDRYYDSSEVIKFPDYTGGFQVGYSLSSFVDCICNISNMLFLCRIITYCNCLSMQNWKLFSCFLVIFVIIWKCNVSNIKCLSIVYI